MRLEPRWRFVVIWLLEIKVGDFAYLVLCCLFCPEQQGLVNQVPLGLGIELVDLM